MRTRGITEEIQHAYNPLPTVTHRELLDAATLDLTEAKIDIPFQLLWKYDAGNATEVMILNPGESHPLRVSEITEFRRRWEEEGMVVLKDPTDEREVRTQALAGLRRARIFYEERGARGLVHQRKIHGYSDEEMLLFKYEHDSYYLNQAKADCIEREMRHLQGVPVTAAREPEAQAVPTPVGRGRKRGRKKSHHKLKEQAAQGQTA